MTTTNKQIAFYNNGNSTIELYDDGTRVIAYPDSGIKLDAPLNVDIRVSSKCQFGLNPSTGKAFCDFCHESARQDGEDCDYEILKQSLEGILPGTEIAIGVNEYTDQLEDFLFWAKGKGLFPNLTINQGHLKRDYKKLMAASDRDLIYGIGVSYRSSLPKSSLFEIAKNKNVVVHVIGGIDTLKDVLTLKDIGIEKILVLGEKSFGFNEGKVDTSSDIHRDWFIKLREVLSSFSVVSFDNLAIDQFKPQRFVNNWQHVYQGEHSFYVDAVSQRYKPSSRSARSTPVSKINFIEYFKDLQVNVDSRGCY